MWIFLSDAFLSIVNNGTPGHLLVRGRARGDIEKVFRKVVKVIETPTGDYRFRATVPNFIVRQAIAAQIAGINYSNFKDSVATDDRHDAYLEVWTRMFAFQRRRLMFEPREPTKPKPARKQRRTRHGRV